MVSTGERRVMTSLSTRILQHISTSPEGAVLHPKGLLHLGSRAAVDQSLSCLARSGQLMRVCQGAYVSPVETRFGTRSPEVKKTIDVPMIPCDPPYLTCPFPYQPSSARLLRHGRARKDKLKRMKLNRTK